MDPKVFAQIDNHMSPALRHRQVAGKEPLIRHSPSGARAFNFDQHRAVPIAFAKCPRTGVELPMFEKRQCLPAFT